MRDSQYRALKKRLNKYHKFTFDIPRKGKEFTPQQKSAITRQANKLIELIKRVENNKATFIKNRKGVSFKDIPRSAKTNLGLIYPQPNAKIKVKKDGRKKKVELVIRYENIVEKYLKFPLDIVRNPELIEIFVDGWSQKLKPDYVMWAVGKDGVGQLRYSTDMFALYMTSLTNSESVYTRDLNKKAQDADIFTGVYFGWLNKGNDMIGETRWFMNSNPHGDLAAAQDKAGGLLWEKGKTKPARKRKNIKRKKR